MELEQRTGREAALNGALERARAELAARTASQTELEAALGALRTELAQLVDLAIQCVEVVPAEQTAALSVWPRAD